MTLIAFPAFDSAGAPLASLTPIWVDAFDAESEAVIVSPPAITEIGGGLYKFTSPAEDIAGVIDLGVTAIPRFLGVAAENVGAITAYGSATQAPLTGLTPVWDSVVDGDGTPITPQPTFVELGTSGVYKFLFPTIAQSEGIIDFGATALPRFVMFERLNPAPGSAPSFSTLEPRVSDGGNTYRIRA